DIRYILRIVIMIAIALFIYILAVILVYAAVKRIMYERSNLSVKFESNIKDIVKHMGRHFNKNKVEIMMLEDYIDLLPVGEIIEEDKVSVSDLKLLTIKMIDVYNRQRFGEIPATGEEVRDSEYLNKYLVGRYFRKFRLRTKIW
ncbi:MAG: hypothetical protein K6A61_11355, partial [Butyrivibrio sp.]|nr:hypothetical protein [Butyrivibrio sp.]